MLNADHVLIAEGVKLSAAKAAKLAATAAAATELVALRESALAIESARLAEGTMYEAMPSEARSTIIKCLFKIRGESGFSKISSKKDTTAYLAALDDVGALLRADVVSDIEPNAEVETPRAVLGDLPPDKQAELEKTHLEILALFEKCKLLVHGRDAAPADAPSAPPDATLAQAEAPSREI